MRACSVMRRVLPTQLPVEVMLAQVSQGLPAATGVAGGGDDRLASVHSRLLYPHKHAHACMCREREREREGERERERVLHLSAAAAAAKSLK